MLTDAAMQENVARSVFMWFWHTLFEIVKISQQNFLKSKKSKFVINTI